MVVSAKSGQHHQSKKEENQREKACNEA